MKMTICRYKLAHMCALLVILFQLSCTLAALTRNFGKAPKQASSTNSTNVTFITGVGCGTVNVQANQVVQISSNNFGKGNYFNNDACTWVFTASDCDLSVYCPCFNIPRSFGCWEDYLKIGYLKYLERFCGENPPVGVYRATTDFLTLRFRSDYKTTGQGFMCLVRCTKTGYADPVPSTNVTCPANTVNPYGVAV